MSSILKYFPFQTLRPYQADVLTAIERNWDSFDYIFLEAPTGFGKSPVAYATAKWLLEEHDQFTHFLASDIYLQNQYIRDFPDLALIKGRSNFPCSVSKRNVTHLYDILEPEYPTCDDGPCILDPRYQCPHKPRRKNKAQQEEDGYIDLEDMDEEPDRYGVTLLWDQAYEQFCPYWKQKDKAVHSPLTIHNYAYFLNEMSFSHSFNRRELAIMDEAHTIETTLMSFIEMQITVRTLDRITNFFGETKINIPNYLDIDGWIDWLKELNNRLTSILNKYGTAKKISSVTNASGHDIRNRLLVENMSEKLSILLNDMLKIKSNWVWNRGDYDITFKPVTIAPYANDALFQHTDKHILISATILDHNRLKEYLGITDEVKFLRIHNSNFPVTNRPLYVKSLGKANQANMETYLPNLINYLDNFLIPQKLKDKGVIHTHTNAIARHILQYSKYRSIMMSNVDNSFNRSDVFMDFFNAPAPKIMVTPSMRMGIDLHDDLARWQVICKIPYPYLGDAQIKRRVEQDPTWYTWQTLMSLMQTYGRICRSDKDFGETYVVDGKFNDIVNQNMAMIPMWFKEAIRRI